MYWHVGNAYDTVGGVVGNAAILSHHDLCWAFPDGYGNDWYQAIAVRYRGQTLLSADYLLDSEAGFDFFQVEADSACAALQTSQARHVLFSDSGFDAGSSTSPLLLPDFGAPQDTHCVYLAFFSDGGFSQQDGLLPSQLGAALVVDHSVLADAGNPSSPAIITFSEDFDGPIDPRIRFTTLTPTLPSVGLWARLEPLTATCRRERSGCKFLHAAASAVGMPCVGDWVCVQYHDADSHASIHELVPRRSFLRRKSPGKNIDYQMIAANIDVAFIVQSCHFDFNVRRLERYLVMVNEGQIAPVLLLTKTDLVSEAELERMIGDIRAAGITARIVPLSNVTGEGVAQVREVMEAGKTYCLLGSSGVGKTTLINQLLSQDALETRAVSGTGEGRHTTTRRHLVVLADGALLIDMPGMRELGILSEGSGLNDSFAEIGELATRCRFSDCSHGNEPGCAIRQSIERGELDAAHYQSYLKLKAELAFNNGSMTMASGSSITASSTGSGNAGNITITSGSTFLMENSTVTTEASHASGGQITINAPDMIRLIDSTVSTSVAGAANDSNGGNISIDPDFVILQNSHILAQAFAGTGGAIDITAGLFLADPSSVVDASSTLGVSGTVQINAPINNLSSVVGQLSESLLAVQTLLRAACAARQAQGQMSSFVERGRDGIPAGPEGLHSRVRISR